MYSFATVGYKKKDLNDNTYWEKGEYSMPLGTSIVDSEGEGANDWDSTAYNMILVNETEKFLDAHEKNHPEKPFFTYLALGAVHVPHSPPDTYLDGSPVAGEHDTLHKDMLGETDKVIGSLMKILEDKNLIHETIIVYTSDNGGQAFQTNYSSGPLRGYKGLVYEGGHRVPMTIRWDNGKVPKGERRSHLVGLNDLFATLCDFAGIKIPIGQAIDSTSFASYALNKDSTKGLREYLGIWNNNKPKRKGIRKGEMKLLYQNNAFELYNLTADISETKDLSKDNQYLVNQMFTELNKMSDLKENFNSYFQRKRKTFPYRKIEGGT